MFCRHCVGSEGVFHVRQLVQYVNQQLVEFGDLLFCVVVWDRVVCSWLLRLEVCVSSGR
jgi:hypothetical protein